MNRHSFRSLLLPLLAVALMLTLLPACTATDAGDPSATVRTYWAALRQGDVTTAREQIADGREPQISGFSLDLMDDRGVMDPMEEALFDRMDLVPTRAQQDGDTAFVSLDISMPDLSEALRLFLTEDMPALMARAVDGSGPEDVEAEILRLLTDALDRAGPVTYREQVELRRERDGWKLYEWHLDDFERAMEDMQQDMAGWPDTVPQ